MTCLEMRREAWTALWKGRWYGRILGVAVLLLVIAMAATGTVQSLCQQNGIAGLEKYAEEWLQASRAGLGRPLVEVRELLRQLGVTAFLTFLNGIFSGCIAFGIASVCLKCARRDDNRWLEDAFGGLKQPFSMLGIVLLTQLLVGFFALLLVVPGIVAWYCFRLAWYVKCDHPDWGAAKCLGESVRLMKGRKWKLFVFDLSYWKALAVVLLPIWASLTLVHAGGVLTALGSLLLLVWIFLAVPVFCFYVSAGRAVFYREALSASDSDAPRAVEAGEGAS